MLEIEVDINRFMRQYAGMLLAEVPDERMAEQPVTGVNHPAWILGHLAFTGDGLIGLLGGEKTFTDEQRQKFGMGSQITTSREDYPTKEELLALLNERFETAAGVLATASADRLAQPNPNEQLREALPTVGHLAAFLLSGHFCIHLGQLSAWRRMIGLPPMF